MGIVEAAAPRATRGGGSGHAIRRLRSLSRALGSPRCPSKRLEKAVDTASPEGADRMSFIVGILLFVVIMGVLDSRLPWSRV